jgi:aromatic ring-cleaving dioxygenase
VIESWHAHIYFDAASREAAAALREAAGKAFPGVELGRMHERPVGPHPRWSCQLAFPAALLGEFLPWLVEHRGGLTLFIHPNSGQSLEDHRDRALWMGEMLPLNLDALRG